MASKYDNRAGGDVAPPHPKVNSLQALTRLRAKRGCEWCTFAFVLNRDMIKSDGTLDDLHAVVFPLGAFDNEEKAEEHAKNVISITGHPGVIAARYGVPVPLTSKFNAQAVTEVPVDMKGRIIELESAQYKHEREEYERRVQQERDIMKEAEEETDTDNIEHFKRQCYLAIKNRANYQHHINESNAAWDNYKKREAMVRDHFKSHPEHEENWLPYLKEKLIERGEMNLYSSLEAAYNEIRNELLGLEDEDDKCTDGVCIATTDSSVASIDVCTDDVCIVTTPIDACIDDVCITTTSIDGVCIDSELPYKVEFRGEILVANSGDDMCIGGICKVSPETDNIKSQPNISHETKDNEEDDDDIIPAEEVVNVVKDVVDDIDPGFVDEPEAEPVEESPPKTGSTQNKRGNKARK